MSKAADYEHLNTHVRSLIRRTIVRMIRDDPRPTATYDQRFDRAVRAMARKYGVKQDTIRRLFSDGASLCLPDDHHPTVILTEFSDQNGFNAQALQEDLQALAEGASTPFIP